MRFLIGLAWLTLGLGTGCSGGGGGGSADRDAATDEDTDPVDSTDSGTPEVDSGRPDPQEDAGDPPPVDAGTCIQGCDEVSAECGTIDDGCGGTIECGDPCERPLSCGGDPALGPNRCGCQAKTCADVVPGGASCGAELDDGCGGTIESCGTCPGAQDVCTDTLTCLCAPDLAACDGKVCGTVSDGCATVACGANGGACAVGDCSADQSACACADKATACVGHDGPLTLPNGCTYDCSATCVPDDVAACAGATCGTARNNCGDVVNCGPNGGGCASGKSCVGTDYVTGTTVPHREGDYQGGLCIATDVANLLGRYGVRTHAFRRAGAGTATVSNSRAEALSLVTVTTTPAGQPHFQDLGCAATSKNFPGTIAATSKATAYAGIPAVELDVNVANGTWTRPIANGGEGVPTGFTVGMPAYCVGHEGADVDLPMGDTRGWFTDGSDAGSALDCRCPTAQEANDLPDPSAAAVNEDCRITDADGDGEAGFTVQASVPLGGALAYNVSVAQITWTGDIVASGHHTGIAIEPSPIQRSTVGCDPTGLLGTTVCGGLAGTGAGSFDCSCGSEHNFIQFAPLDGVSDPGENGWSCADVVSQAATLFASFGSCTTTAECPDNTLCNGGRCWPATTAGACSAQVACPTDMRCENDGACWPLSSECPSPDTSPSDACTYTVPP